MFPDVTEDHERCAERAVCAEYQGVTVREASDAVQHLLVVEELTQQQIDDARDRLARAYQQVKDADEAVLRV